MKQLVVILQKYLHVRPTELCAQLNRSLGSNMITWDQLLSYLHQEISLQDQVTKLSYSRPFPVEIFYNRDPDRFLDQTLFTIVTEVKRKETNSIRSMCSGDFLGFKALAVILDK